MLPFLLFTHQWWGQKLLVLVVDARPKTKDDMPLASFHDDAKRILQILQDRNGCCIAGDCCG
uniref:Conotoxin n=1 Tax=Conus episcopatus TaxID=88764 RepID=A0A0K2S728_CONEP|nr:Conotoxin Superfamily SF3 [Conus episcopatus]